MNETPYSPRFVQALIDKCEMLEAQVAQLTAIPDLNGMAALMRIENLENRVNKLMRALVIAAQESEHMAYTAEDKANAIDNQVAEWLVKAEND